MDGLSLVAEPGPEPEDDDDVVIQMPVGMNVDHGKMEALLAGMCEAASLNIVLRDFAKSKGLQRLGKNVRKSLETELDILSRKGKILIKGGVIRLL